MILRNFCKEVRGSFVIVFTFRVAGCLSFIFGILFFGLEDLFFLVVLFFGVFFFVEYREDVLSVGVEFFIGFCDEGVRWSRYRLGKGIGLCLFTFLGVRAKGRG